MASVFNILLWTNTAITFYQYKQKTLKNVLWFISRLFINGYKFLLGHIQWAVVPFPRTSYCLHKSRSQCPWNKPYPSPFSAWLAPVGCCQCLRGLPWLLGWRTDPVCQAKWFGRALSGHIFWLSTSLALEPPMDNLKITNKTQRNSKML